VPFSRSNGDVIVVGGGVIGCLVARALADAGRRVVLLEAGSELGGAASSAAAGLLSPQMEAAEEILVTGATRGGRHDAMLALCLVARSGYAAFAEAIESETGIAIHLRTDGTLVVALEADEAARLERRARAQQERELRAEWLEPAETRALEPAITADALGALHLPDDHQVDNLALVRAAAAAVRARPAIDVRVRAAVMAVRVEKGRVTGVRLAAATVAADLVVLATGAWTATIGGLPRRVAVRPVKGQMAALLPSAPLFRRVVGGRGVYCVPRDDGRVLVGATVEEAGFDVTVDAAAVEGLLAAAAAVVPGLAAAPLHSRWAGLRPGTADDLPLLGADPELEGLIWATGHYRNGILLAPLTAEVVTALAEGEAPSVDLTPFAPDRPIR
jgi:glycine oxidase